MGIDAMGVGHVVLKVTDVGRSLDFYCSTLGLTEVARGDFGDGTMVFMSSGRNHHDIGLVEVPSDARRPDGSDIGLYHVALKIPNDLDALRATSGHAESSPGWHGRVRINSATDQA